MRFLEAAPGLQSVDEEIDTPIKETVLAVIADKTGYPPEMLEPDLDLEADLGIDSVKQAEILGLLQERYGMPADLEAPLRELNTIGRIIAYVQQVETRANPVQTTKAGESPLPALDQVANTILALIADKTGYPLEMLEPDLDLEADLGIDSVKQAEIFGLLQERYAMPPDQEVPLRELNTISRIIAYTRQQLAAAPESPKAVPGQQPAGFTLPEALTVASNQAIGRRYVPLAIAQDYPRQQSDPSTFSLRGRRALLIADRSGEVASLVWRALRDRETRTVILAPENVILQEGVALPVDFASEKAVESAVEQARGMLERIEVVINCFSLANATSLFTADAAVWQGETDRQFNANFHSTRACYADLSALYPDTGGYFAATAIGGAFGLEASAGTDPLGAITAGFVKSLQKELPHLVCKVVDFPVDARPAFIAERLLAEIETRQDQVEIAYTRDRRAIIQVLPVEIGEEGPPLRLDAEQPIVVSGGGRGIVAECLKGLARVCRAPLVLTGRTPMPAGDEQWLHLGQEAFARYRKEYMIRLKKEQPSLSPLQIERKSRTLVHGRELFATLRELRRLNPRVSYAACDVGNREQVHRLIAGIREQFGPLQGVLHGAGLESLGAVPKKPIEHSRNVLRVKVNGLRHLLEATREEPLRFFAHFGSISGRFGMDGQVDYCAASMTAATCSALQARRNEGLRAFTLDWTAWADKGMAAHESVRRAQEGQRGLAYLGVREGVAAFLRELFWGGDYPEVLYFGALGTNQPLGQLDSLAAADCVRPGFVRPDGVIADRIHFSLLESLHQVQSDMAITARKRLTVNEDLYLADHLVEGTPTFPGVFHVESHCQVARLLGADFHLARLGKVEFVKFIKFFERNPLTLRTSARIEQRTADEVEISAEIRSDFINAQGVVLEPDRLHSRGRYLFRSQAEPPPTAPYDTARAWAGGRSMDLEKFYRRTHAHITFGPLFRCLQEVRWLNDGDLLSATLVPSGRGLLGSIPAPRFCTAPIVLDNACRAILLWSFHTQGAVVVPRAIREARLYRNPNPGETVYARATLLDQQDDLYFFKVTMVDQHNQVLIDMPHLTLIRISSEKDDTRLL